MTLDMQEKMRPKINAELRRRGIAADPNRGPYNETWCLQYLEDHGADFPTDYQIELAVSALKERLGQPYKA